MTQIIGNKKVERIVLEDKPLEELQVNEKVEKMVLEQEPFEELQISPEIVRIVEEKMEIEIEESLNALNSSQNFNLNSLPVFADAYTIPNFIESMNKYYSCINLINDPIIFNDRIEEEYSTFTNDVNEISYKKI